MLLHVWHFCFKPGETKLTALRGSVSAGNMTNSMQGALNHDQWVPPLTEGLLVHYKAAHNPFITASQGEAVPSEDDVEGLCGM